MNSGWKLSALVSGLAMVVLQGCGTKECDGNAGGSGEVSGMALGNQWTSIKAAYRLGHVDEPDLTVLFAFDQGVTCCEMHAEGWDERVQNGTQMLEIAFAGTEPGVYPISTEAEPAEGESSFAAKYKTLDGLQESAAESGSITIDSIDEASVTGSYDVMLAEGAMTGTLSAVGCAEGREP